MRESDFSLLTESIKQAGEIKKGKLAPGRRFRFDPLDVKETRRKLGKSQSEFASMIGVSVSTLQNWEQGRRRPRGPAMALLRVASKNPEVVERALSGSSLE
jgi:putative transcriptional regulator